MAFISWEKQWEKSSVHELDSMHRTFKMSFPCAGGHIARVIMHTVIRGRKRKERRPLGSRIRKIRSKHERI